MLEVRDRADDIEEFGTQARKRKTLGHRSSGLAFSDTSVVVPREKPKYPTAYRCEHFSSQFKIDVNSRYGFAERVRMLVHLHTCNDPSH